MKSMRGCLYHCYRDGIQGFAEFWRTTALASRVTVACPQRKHSAQDYLPVARWVLETPELWGGGFEAKANFGSAALLLT